MSFGREGPRTLLVWDFDLSLINANVDTLILSDYPELLDEQTELWKRTHRHGGADDAAAGEDKGDGDASPSPAVVEDWVDVMNESLRRLSARVTDTTLKDHIHRKLDAALALEDEAKALLHPKVKEAVVEAYVRGWDQAVVSQANTELIGYVLEQANMTPIMEDRVFTFPASFSDDANSLSVRRYHGGGDALKPAHSCTRTLLSGKPSCHKMMCKGTILREELRAFDSGYEHIVYVGDGLGDFCPCAQLRDSDAVLSRAGFALSLELERSGDSIPARVVDWENYEELFDGLENVNQAWAAKFALDQGLLPEGFVLADNE
jgi:phosphoglycolate phosphatase-like HAD superfamily hydrolase